MNIFMILGITLGIRIAFTGTKKLYKIKKERKEIEHLFI